MSKKSLFLFICLALLQGITIADTILLYDGTKLEDVTDVKTMKGMAVFKYGKSTSVKQNSEIKQIIKSGKDIPKPYSIGEIKKEDGSYQEFLNHKNILERIREEYVKKEAEKGLYGVPLDEINKAHLDNMNKLSVAYLDAIQAKDEQDRERVRLQKESEEKLALEEEKRKEQRAEQARLAKIKQERQEDLQRAEKAKLKKYWLNSNSGVRHNSGCRYYRNTKSGYPVTKDSGRACGKCGG